MATIRLLDNTLHLLELMLAAEHPSLFMEHAHYGGGAPPTLRTAKTLLRRAAAFRGALRRYTLAVHDAIRPQDLPPDDIF
jgi:hypothetical protein